MEFNPKAHKRSRAFLLLVMLFLVSALGYFTLFHKRPVQRLDICRLMQAHPDWYFDAKASEKKWGVPVSVQLAIIQQESQFISNAKPIKEKIFGIFKVAESSALGYAQVVDATWRYYLEETHQYSADRQRFDKAVDFIGWFVNKAHQRLKFPKNDAYKAYLTYHEGFIGYKRHSYLKKAWLQHVARKVQRNAAHYHLELARCKIRKSLYQNTEKVYITDRR